MKLSKKDAKIGLVVVSNAGVKFVITKIYKHPVIKDEISLEADVVSNRAAGAIFGSEDGVFDLTVPTKQ